MMVDHIVIIHNYVSDITHTVLIVLYNVLKISPHPAKKHAVCMGVAFIVCV